MIPMFYAGPSVLLALTEPRKRAVYFLVILALGFILMGFHFAKVRAVYGRSGSDPEGLINCSSCGSRIPAESDVCDHCEEPL